ncbi:PREDICTED: heparin cofactor 2-like isoform X2 [Wasmannia auropunctata]|uniref:heparin cofactor 2-like isoform X2 n=1 Tax=Wasmannia auropunctata TaxID=64793 RepID=UPI0005ED5D65|nr:PREDICTED: heparin cofactor 2-like isoform X2 [Wasmannia auropunctata]
MRLQSGYLLCLSIAVVFIKENACAVAQNPAQTSNSSRINSQVEDDEDFVPYQGERLTIFDWILFRTLSKANSGNVLLSPISIKLALVLLYEGAQDQTAHELAGAMPLPVSMLATREKFSNILTSLQAPSSAYTLNLGSRIYIDNNISTRQRYSATVKTFYHTDVINDNLSDTHAIANKVNTWINNITNGHIEKIIDDEKGLEDSVMLIVNGLFFKGAWRRRYFAPENTRVSKFHINVNESVDVPYMYTVNRFYYTESSRLDAKILRIPYDGSKFAMYIILPHTLTGVDHIVDEINSFTLARDVWAMQELPLNVWIPKFKFEFTSHLENTLRELGIRDIFDDTALLTGIAKTKRASRHLRVSDVLHKTGIEVNENGTTAYAATEIQIGNKIDDGTFNANHPFVFYIEDETTGTILYIGKFQNPLKTSGTTGKVQQQFPSRFNPDTATVTPNPVPAAFSTEDRYSFFNIHLLQRVSETVEGNLILSPASVKIALTSLVEGTGGQTRHELLAALRLPPDEYIIRRIARRALTSLKSQQNGTEIDVATRLWTNPSLAVSTNYMTALRNYYGADVQQLNFGNANDAANIINSWVRENTRNNIKSIIQPGTLSADTQIVLTSALYFKGRWLKAFDRDATRVRCFRVPQSGCQDVFMMENASKYRYGYIASLDADVVEIPYSNGRTSMLVFLPSHEESDPHLHILSNDLSYAPMRTLLTSLNETDLILGIPRFSIESKLDLHSPLTHMGVQDIFSPAANFTGITSNDYLRIGNIIQNAKIEVDEEGTIAAAVTELVVVPLMANMAPTFRANRPFIFAIVDLVTSETLFAGRFMGPNAGNSRTI